MICPYKLTANPEDVERWATSSIPRTRVDQSHRQEGMFPVVTYDRATGSTTVSAMFPASKVDHRQTPCAVSAGLLASDSLAWEAFCNRRCLILVSALRVERTQWNEVQSVFEFRPADEPLFALAGVWDAATSADGTSTKVFRAITIHPSILLGDLFKEMPVIVAQSDYTRWLEIQVESTLPIEVLRPLRVVEMKRWIMVPEDKQRVPGGAGWLSKSGS